MKDADYSKIHLLYYIHFFLKTNIFREKEENVGKICGIPWNMSCGTSVTTD